MLIEFSLMMMSVYSCVCVCVCVCAHACTPVSMCMELITYTLFLRRN